MSFEDNKQLVRRLVEVVNARDLAVLDDSPRERSPRRRDGGSARSAVVPDFTMKIVDLIAEDDKIVAHVHCSGTHLGEWHRRPATDRRFEDVDEIYIFRIRNGRPAGAPAVVEDNLTRMKQLGFEL